MPDGSVAALENASPPAAIKAAVAALNWILGVLFFAVLLLVNAQIVFRFVFSISVPWTEEVSRLLFVYVVYLGAAVAYHERSMITIDTLAVMGGSRLAWLRPLVAAVVLFIVGFLFAASIPMVMAVWDTSLSTVAWISNGWAYLALTVSFGLMLLHSLASLVMWIVRLRRGQR